MDYLNESLLKFWNSLNNFEVRFIMVGGVSVNVHGYPRTTNDVDIWLDDTLENRINFGQAMQQIGLPKIDFTKFQFEPGCTSLQISTGVDLDVLTSMKGLENMTFEECYKLADRFDIDGVITPFLHIHHLIENKKAVNRPKDQLDVIELEKIIKIKRDNNL